MALLLDHLVLPVADLDVARARLTALGFTVAPDGIHPFGTVNCCVYLPDGTFFEPLAVWDPALAADAIRAGNVFVARDHVFRAAVGDEGLSAVVLATADADADHARFTEAGIAIGDVLTFSRDVVDAAGRKDVATFKLAFAGDPDVVDAFAFSCQRINAPKVDRAALQNHTNGVGSVSAIILADEARDYARLIAEAAGGAVDKDEVRLGPVAVPCGGEAFAADVRGSVHAISFQVTEVVATADVLARNGITHHMEGERIVVPPAPGQGVFFIFEASR